MAVTVPSVPQTVERKCWGEHGEYGPYRVGADGLPYLCDVVWDFLKRNALSVEAFAQVFGRLAKPNGEPYTKSRLYQMLRENTFPTDPRRRWILVKLLHIPPLLLGLSAIDDLLPSGEEAADNVQRAPTHAATSADTSGRRLHLEEYHHALTSYWQQHRGITAQDQNAVADMRGRVRRLEKEVLYGEPHTRTQGIPLLCGYLMLLAAIAGSHEHHNAAVIHLNQAYVLAKEKQLYQLLSAILYRRGWAFKDRGERYERQGNQDEARRDLRFAADDFQLAFTFEKKLPPGINGRLILAVGEIEVALAQTPSAFSQALHKFDQAELFVDKQNDEEDLHFLTLNEERYHLDRATAYLAAPVQAARYPRDGRRELRNAMSVTSLPSARVQAYGTLLKARSYYLEGEYEAATSNAREALLMAWEIKSTYNIVRVATLYDALKSTDYGTSSLEVAALEIELIRAQQPGRLL